MVQEMSFRFVPFLISDVHQKEQLADVQSDTDEGYDVHANEKNGLFLRSRDETVNRVWAWPFRAEYRNI